MNLELPKPEIRSATRVTGGPVTPRKGPPKFKQRQTRQFKSKPPKKGLGMTFLEWKAWEQTSRSSAHGRPSTIWSCTSWPSTVSSSRTSRPRPLPPPLPALTPAQDSSVGTAPEGIRITGLCLRTIGGGVRPPDPKSPPLPCQTLFWGPPVLLNFQRH